MRAFPLTRHSYILLLVAAIVLNACINKAVPKSVRTALESVQHEYAPDQRTALFDLKLHQQNDTLYIDGETNLPEAHRLFLQQLDQQQILYTDRVKVLPGPGLQGLIRAVVNVSVANIRVNPKHSGELATQALLGTGLKVLKKDGDWYYVQSPDGYLGWLDSGALQLMTEQDYTAWLSTDKVILVDDYGFVLDSPGPQAGRVGDLVAGNILIAAARVGDRQEVVYPDGRRGYVPAAQVSLLAGWLQDHQELSIPALIRTAMNLMGRPYLWGGTSGKGMDCSGFTKTVYFMNGFVLPRDASQQVNAGIEIATDSTFSSLQTGDFLFFGQPEIHNQKEKIRHVGIYLSDGQFIHSGADNPGVSIQSLLPGSPNFAPERRQTFIRARRMEVGSPGVIPISDLGDFYGEPATTDPLIQ